MAKKKKRIETEKDDGGANEAMQRAERHRDSGDDLVDLNFKVPRSLRTAFKREALDRGKTSKELLKDMISALIGPK
jgi:hypothetical protein